MSALFCLLLAVGGSGLFCMRTPMKLARENVLEMLGAEPPQAFRFLWPGTFVTSPLPFFLKNNGLFLLTPSFSINYSRKIDFDFVSKIYFFPKNFFI